MPGWTLTVDTHPTQGPTFQRPLRGLELAFFWDAYISGTGDTVHYAALRLLNASRDAHLFSERNIVKAWLSTKRRYPLSGASIEMLPGVWSSVHRVQMVDTKLGSCGGPISGVPHFVVREHDLAVLRPHEIVFAQIACVGEVQEQMIAIWNGPRLLSDELLTKLYVFRETGSQSAADALHLITLMAHYVSDGTAHRSFVRCLLDTLARGEGPDSEPAQPPLQDRLAMVIPSADLEPPHLYSLGPARMQWRRAIGTVIRQLRMANFSQGGHTLPCRVTRSTPHTPSRPGFISNSLTREQTTNVIASCRSHGITFGNAYLALAQVAMTRVLYRRYLRGEISEEEWSYRKKQPYRTVGPLNLRPYLDKSWFENGGGGEFVLSMNFFFVSLPFMTLGETERRQCDLSDGAPPFSDLLTFDRFLHRASLVKKQTKAFFGHPLFFEFIRLTNTSCARRSCLFAQERATKHPHIFNDGAHEGSTDEDVLAVTDMPLVFAHGGSSFGNVDLISPIEYPLPATHPLSPLSATPHPFRAGYAATPPATGEDLPPRIVMENAAITRPHTRPAELYLGAVTSHEQLNVYVAYDANVFEHVVVREWLDEVKGAVLWYLGETSR